MSLHELLARERADGARQRRAFDHHAPGELAESASARVYGALYLRTVGPFYGFFGIGLALYFASKGAGKLAWSIVAAITRVVIAAVGGFGALSLAGSSVGLFAAIACALVVFGASMQAVSARASARSASLS